MDSSTPFSLPPEIAAKYFWDGTQNLSEDFIIRRLLEYAAFPDLLDIPAQRLHAYLLRNDVNRLRASQRRKEFLQAALPYLANANSLEDAVFRMVEHDLSMKKISK